MMSATRRRPGLEDEDTAVGDYVAASPPKIKRSRPRYPTKAELAAEDVLGAIRSCARRLHAAAWCCDTLAPTVTGFVADIRSGFSTHDMPVEALRDAALAAGELTTIATMHGWSIKEALARVFVRDQLFYDCELSK